MEHFGFGITRTRRAIRFMTLVVTFPHPSDGSTDVIIAVTSIYNNYSLSLLESP